MVRKFTLIYCMIVLMIQSSAYAGVKEDYEQARKIYIAAEACMAAYSDRYGHLANVSLERNGWLTNRYEKTGKNVDARFLLLKKQTQKGKQVFILAIVGTENAKDIRSNLKVEKAFFAGTKLDEFAANAEKTRVSNTEPKVHRGFHNFVQALLTTKTRDNTGNLVYLTDILLASSEQKIYIVGHSRGGAAATLVAARMISMGIKPEQIEVITFGAPAVGNDAFAAEFAPVMNLTRVVMSGDPFTGILQKLVRGYKQFGRKILWESQGEQSHELTEYTDRAIKMYYDTRRDALRAGVVQFPPKQAPAVNKGQIYVAALKNNLPKALDKEYWYINQVILDEYRHILPEPIFTDDDYTDLLRKRAADAGCKWLIVPEVSGYRVKDERNVYYISLTQTVYDVVTGRVIKTASFSTSTHNLTPLEAFIHVCKDMNYDWLIQK